MFTDPIPFAGEELRFEIQVDWSEWDRRRRTGACASCSPDALEFLFDLPEDLAVSLDEMPEVAAEVLARVPTWAARVESGWITRAYRPAGTVRMGFAADAMSPWGTQLEALRWVTAVCPTTILVADMVEAFEALEAAAAAGVGVGVLDGEGWFVVLEPKVHAVQLTPSRWLLAERAVSGLTGRCEEFPSRPEPTPPSR